MSRLRSGACQCGAVRYQVAGEPLRIGICHCTDCRQSSGSAFTMFAIWPRSAFQSEGQYSAYKGRSFCRDCGSRLFSLTADEAEIMCGTLHDAPTDMLPAYELWTPRREPWLLHLPWADQFRRDRPSRLTSPVEAAPAPRIANEQASVRDKPAG